MEDYEIRCPYGVRELFAKLEINEVIEVDKYNLLKFKCSWCTRQAKKTNPTVYRVIHHYNLLGQHCDDSMEYSTEKS
jgi:hypothetical protein